MTNNILGIIAAFLLIIVVIAVSTILQKFKILSSEGSRKFIHIGVAHDWIILMILFDNMWLACIPPAVFIFLNYASYKLNLIKSMERAENNSLGTVYFPISLLILVIATFSLDMTYLGAVGMLVLGYGDGLAGWIGEKYGKNKIFKNKSLQGSTAMFIASFVTSFIVMSLFTPDIAISGSIIIAILATSIELFTPLDFDNLTVPLGSTAIYYGLIMVGSAATNLILFALIINLIIAFAANKKKALDLSGIISAVILGSTIYLCAGPLAWLMLMVFFTSSSVITHMKKTYKQKLSSEYEKTARTYKQVIATGSVPLVLSIIYFVTKSDIFLLAAISNIAISCADTWASEIGVLNKGKTLSIITFKPVKKGVSGGISALGTLVSFAGALMIATIFSIAYMVINNSSLEFTLVSLFGITLIGFLGSIIDSIFGATIQARHTDSKTGQITEARKTDGQSNKTISGIKYVSNNAVNLLTGIIGGIIGLLVFALALT